MMCKRQGKSLLKLDPSCFNSKLFFVRTHMYVRTQKYVDTYCICLSNYITPNKMGITKYKVDNIHDLIVKEETPKLKKFVLCCPDHPCLDNKYKV
jgi:hypothetical protein